jgi:hypothetical protein
MNRRFGREIAFACALAAGGCAGPAQEEAPGVEGTYRLIGTRAGPVPIELDFSGGCLTALMASEVRIETAGRYRSTFNVQRACPDSTVILEDPGITGRFRRSRDSLFFIAPDGRDAGRARIRGDTLNVRGGLHELVYVRRGADGQPVAPGASRPQRD